MSDLVGVVVVVAALAAPRMEGWGTLVTEQFRKLLEKIPFDKQIL